MNLALFILPLEVWMDILVYPWINRPKLAQMVDKLGNRKFAEILQFFLHDFRKITLQELYFSNKLYYLTSDEIVPNDPYQSCLVAESMNFQPCEIAQVPMTSASEKIVNFKLIEINCFDGQVLKFLINMKPLFNNVVLNLNGHQHRRGSLPVVLGHLLPLLSGIRAIRCDWQSLRTLDVFFPETLAGVDILDICDITSSETSIQSSDSPSSSSTSHRSIIITDWLIAPARDCNAPKLCIIKTPDFARERVVNFGNDLLLDAIVQDFLYATVPSTFAVYIEMDPTLDGFNMDNDIGEHLLGLKYSWDHGCTFLIVRHQDGADSELRNWLGENENYIMKRIGNEQVKCGTIKIVDPTIGYIEEMNNGNNDWHHQSQQSECELAKT